MSHPIASHVELRNDENDKTSQSAESDKSQLVITGEDESEKISFADKEKLRRSRANKRFREKKIIGERICC